LPELSKLGGNSVACVAEMLHMANIYFILLTFIPDCAYIIFIRWEIDPLMKEAKNMTKTYTVTSANGLVLAHGLDEKTAASMVRGLSGATFRREFSSPEFAPAEQFSVGEWAWTLRDIGYMHD
jgi:hypothetical protein